jgi:hypothetical protein
VGGRYPPKFEVGDGDAYIPQYFINIINCHSIFHCLSFFGLRGTAKLNVCLLLPQTKISFSKNTDDFTPCCIVFPRLVSWHIFDVHFEKVLHLFVNQTWGFPFPQSP